jgi:radical SAM protein with 4Fe4S-binding SPASM domain
MTTEELLTLIDQLYSAGVGTLIFSGGEPLCRPDIFDIAHYADEQGFSLMLSSNGTLIDEETASIIASSGFSTVQVSLDGIHEAQHEALTGVKGSYRKTLNALENLEKAGIKVCTVATVVTTLNVKDIHSFIEKIRSDTPAFAVRLIRFLPVGRGEQSHDLEVSVEDIKKLYHMIQEMQKKVGESFFIRFSEAFNAPLFDRPSHPCTGGHSWCCVTPEGYVIPCNYFSAPDVAKILGADNIRDTKFMNIWKSSRLLQKFRNPLTELKGKCKDCDVVKECRGGCRAVSFSYTHDILAPNPFCSYKGG